MIPSTRLPTINDYLNNALTEKQNRRGGLGASQNYPCKKRVGKRFGHTEGLGVVLTRELEVLAMLTRWRKKFPPFKSGAWKFYPVSGGGRGVVGGGAQTRYFPIL